MAFYPINILIALCFLVVLIYIIYSLTGITSIKRGENQFDNKNEQGFYIIKRLLENLGYSVQNIFMEDLHDPGCLIYLNYENDLNEEKISEWIKKGNILFIFGILDNVDPFFSFPHPFL